MRLFKNPWFILLGFRNVVDAFLLRTTDEKRRDGLYSVKESLPRPLVFAHLKMPPPVEQKTPERFLLPS